MVSLRQVDGKKLVSSLRNGDFAHAGETDAIDMVMRHFKKNSGQAILDVGCGLGGTSDYIQKQKWGHVYAFDIEKESIEYAKKTYPDISFYESDVTNVHHIITQVKFDIVCLFNVFYAFQDQAQALKSIRHITKKKGKIAIFDYSDPTGENQITPFLNRDNKYIDSSTAVGAPFIPIKPSEIGSILLSSGWSITELVDISKLYEKWYLSLVSKLENRKKEIIHHYGEELYARAYDVYSKMLAGIQNKLLGGVIVYAEAT